ncbi:MAG: biotin transporter BioY [Dialister sp.]
MENTKIRMQVLAALFAAACAVLAQLIIPIQPVPISLASLGAMLAGGFLGKRYGFLALLIYLLLGAAGVPVFLCSAAGFTCLPDLRGFLLGFAPMAFAVGWLCEKTEYKFIKLFGAIFLGNLVCYVFGIAWFVYLTHTDMWTALTLCVFPFIPGDLLKIVLSAFLVSRYRNRLLRIR